MTAPHIIRFEPQGPAGAGLQRWPDIPAEELVAGTPVQRGHYYIDDKVLGLSAGVWDCTAMTGKMGPYSVNEFMILLEGAVTIVDAQGGEVTVRAGESFIIPKGLVCSWKQTGYVRKFFVIFEDASGMAAADASALRVLRPDPAGALEPSEGPPDEVLIGPRPVQRNRTWFTDPTGQLTVGVWESTPYRRKTIDFPRHELMHIVAGEVTLTEEGGAPQRFGAGDTFFVPLGCRGDWVTTGDIRKIYCIFQPKAAAAAEAAE